MKKILNTLKGFTMVFPGIIAIPIIYILEWLISCGIIKLITLCFSLNFSWLVATGIWLILKLLHSCFN